MSEYELLAQQGVPLSRGEARRTTDEVVPLVAHAVARYARGELVGFEVIPGVMPGPVPEGGREPQWNPALWITIDIAPAAGVGTANRILNVSNALPPTASGWSQDEVDAIVRTLLDGCFELRAQQMAEVTAAAQNGADAPKITGTRSRNGLYLP